MIISVASGKGGTGKTLVATSLVHSLKSSCALQLLDCDVEEPNDHVFLKPKFTGSKMVSIMVPMIDQEKCTYCGKCAEVCAYHAIAVIKKHVLTFPALCHGCGACSYLCPEKAISEEGRETGRIEWGCSDGVGFVHGKLGVGEAMAPPVIRNVKEYANSKNTVIIDAPPGTSCPVVEAIKGSDFCLLVTEPTPFGLNDLIIAVEMVKELDIPCGVVLNRAGVGDAGVQEYCRKESIPILLTIPLDIEIARLYSNGISMVEGLPQWRIRFSELFEKVKELIDEEVVILSGKGGTGKTTLVGSLAALAEEKVLTDCDVDAADLHLLLSPSEKQRYEFWSGQVAHIDEKICTQCSQCQEICRFNAIKDFKIDPVSCEGCGFCFHTCPDKAITMKDKMSGHWFISDTPYGPLVHARLGIAQENSGKLVAIVRQQAKKIAENEGKDLIISDGPPGIGCPVISSLSGATLALLVTEPTLSGIHDLDRILNVCAHFGIYTLVCINKCDLNPENTKQIESQCISRGVEIAGKIPFDNVVTESIVQGVPLVKHSNGPVSLEIKRMWSELSAKYLFTTLNV